jgi:hypothetical protein
MAAALLAGCATAPPSGDRTAKPGHVERATDKEPYDFRSEGKIPPLAPGDAQNEPDVQEIGVTEGSSIDVTDAEAPPPVAPSPSDVAPATALADGFRIQVFASADRDIAENAARDARERLGLSTYVDLDSGMYKVRAGDFTTRADADRALPAVRRDYSDAWIVAAKVRAPTGP